VKTKPKPVSVAQQLRVAANVEVILSGVSEPLIFRKITPFDFVAVGLLPAGFLRGAKSRADATRRAEEHIENMLKEESGNQYRKCLDALIVRCSTRPLIVATQAEVTDPDVMVAVADLGNLRIVILDQLMAKSGIKEAVANLSSFRTGGRSTAARHPGEKVRR
jgi:hypothetical protein